MLVKDVMTRNVPTVSPDAFIQEAARLMAERDIGVLPVVGNDGSLGIVTNWDIAVRAVAAGLEPGRVRVSEVMTPRSTSVYECDEALDAARLLEEEDVLGLVVLDARDRVSGILSLGDVALVSRDVPAMAEALIIPALQGLV